MVFFFAPGRGIPVQYPPMRINLRLYHEALLRLIYPASCGACNTSLEIREKNLCSACSKSLESLSFGPSELLADHPFEFIGNAWSVYPYESPAREILAGIKFYRQRWLLGAFSGAVSLFASTVLAESRYDFLVPVPIDRGRLGERHFNQSEILAGMLSKACGTPVETALRKPYSTPAQSRLNQKERRANLYGVFSAPKPEKISGKRILLVDDILTTGATSDEAARVLKNAGARSVDLFTLARTGSQPAVAAEDFKNEDGILAGLFS